MFQSVQEKVDASNNSLESSVIALQRRPGGYETLGKLLEINPRELTPSGRIDYLACLEKQHSWLTSLIQEATLAIAGDEASESENPWEGVDDSEREDVATALRLSPITAQSRIDVARTLAHHLPATSEALATGSISSHHATLIARESAEAIRQGLAPEILLGLEAKALAYSEFHTPAQVGRKFRNLIAQSAPDLFEEKYEIARDTRSVRLIPESDGMSTLLAILPAADAQTVFMAINSMIEIDKGSHEKCGTDDMKGSTRDPRSIEALRADALTAIASDFLGRISPEYLPHRRPVSVNLTIDLPTLLGLAENPAQLAGYGPIPASVGRALAADGRWRRFITDPRTGNLLDCGRETYLPPQHLVDFLMARDRICRFPGCSQPARLTDIDHAQSWDEGGETRAGNLGLLCRRHHRMKTHGGWKLESYEDGSCRWISPAGKEFFVPARPMNESV